MAPIVNGLIPEFEGRVAIRKYNPNTSDAAARLAQQYEVQFVPTFVFVDANGSVVDTIVGEVPEKTLRNALEDLAK